MTDFEKQAREAAKKYAQKYVDESVKQFPRLNPDGFKNESTKLWIGFEAGAEFGARQMIEELRSVKPGEPYWWIGKEIANALESKLNERE